MVRTLLLLIFLLSLPGLCWSEGEEVFIYDAHGQRDPFVPLIGVASGGSASAGEILSIEDVVFQGSALDAKGNRIVVINGELFREGDSAGAMVVLKIGSDIVTVTVQGRDYDLTLYQEELRR